MNQPEPNIPPRTSPQAPPRDRHGPDWWLMFRKFLKHGSAIASVAPSSRAMVKALLKQIDFDAAQCIVELGAGTGPITAELVKRVRPGCKLLVIERDAQFVEVLRKKFPTLDVAHADAGDLERLLDERGIDKADHIVSGLPMPSLPQPVQARIYQAFGRRLQPHGSVAQITVLPWVFYKYYRRQFSDVKFQLVALNVPPGGVYFCRGSKAAVAV